MAIGQLYDYARYIEPRPRLCVLTPARRPGDMLALLGSLAMGVAWRQGSGTFAMQPEWV